MEWNPANGTIARAYGGTVQVVERATETIVFEQLVVDHARS
jgi:hypothetical protein